MSWITGLADKAENILNKIDQNAATALQLPATPELTLEVMRKGLSSSTLSLKSNISPIRRPDVAGGADSVKSENATVTDASALEKEKLPWHIEPTTEMTMSRRSSLSGSSKAEAITIDMGAEVTNVPESNGAVQLSSTSSTALLTSADNQELAAFRIALSQVTSERDELRLRLSALNRDIENAGLRQRAQELEMLAQRLTEERDCAQQELSELQMANSAYVHSISELETNLAKTQQEYFELAQKLQMQMKETEQQRVELQEYRTKAQRALQMKDALIAELKSNSAGSAAVASATDESDARLLHIELDALKQEYQQTQMDNENLRTHLEELRLDWQSTLKQHEQQLTVARASEESLRKELRAERERLLASESEQRVSTQELAKLRQQLSNQMATAATRLQEREQQLQRLRAERGGSNSDYTDDYDARLKTLTQTLVDKQNAVEKVTAERNALRIQLEKVQDQLQQTIYSYSISSKNTRTGNTTFSLANGSMTDDAKAQIPFLLRDNPFDNRVSRNMKRFYSCLDSAGIRLMRSMRYPLWRTFVLMYIVLLHVWVMFVLLSSTPN